MAHMVDVIIVGAGAIGCSTLLQLAKRSPVKGSSFLLIDACDIASAASGRAGGFLARHWCQSEGAVEKLSHVSYDMHCHFAAAMQTASGANDIGFRFIDALEVKLSTKRRNKDADKKSSSSSSDEDDGETNEKVPLPSWLDGPVIITGKCTQIGGGDRRDTAQVHPKLLCQAMVKEARALAQQGGFSCMVRQHSPVRRLLMAGGRCTGVVLANGEEIRARCCVVLTVGPWTHFCQSWITSSSPTADETQVASEKKSRTHSALTQLAQLFVPYTVQSIVLKPKQQQQQHDASNPTTSSCVPVLNRAIFSSAAGAFDPCVDLICCEPEIYPRPDGTVFVCGIAARDPLPENPEASVAHTPASSAKLLRLVHNMSTHLRDNYCCSGGESDHGAVDKSDSGGIVRQACYLPTTKAGRRPIIGEVPGSSGTLYLSSGHTCWGILWSHGTGLVLAEMISEVHRTSLFSASAETGEEKGGGDSSLSRHLEALLPINFINLDEEVEAGDHVDDVDDVGDAASAVRAGKRGNADW